MILQTPADCPGPDLGFGPVLLETGKPESARPIRFMRPTLPEPAKWLPFLEEAYKAQWFSNFGPVHTRFASALTERYGSAERVALPVSNCTAGITAALLGLGVRGKVAMPSFTFSAPAHALLAASCTPVFCDIDPVTWEMSADALEDLLRREPVVAVLHVRCFGLCRDLSATEAVCRRHGVPLIVDAAAALGGVAESGPAIGHAGRFEVFSLHATKTFGIGEGGVIFSSPDDAQRLHSVINFGLEAGEIRSVGLNGKMCEMHAAIGLAVLGELHQRIAVRSAAAVTYRRVLNELQLPLRHAACPGRPPWSAYPVELESVVALEEVRHKISAQVETKPYYLPVLHRTLPFHGEWNLPNTDALNGRIVCLPIYSDMTPAESREVGEVLRAALEGVKDARPALDSRG